MFDLLIAGRKRARLAAVVIAAALIACLSLGSSVADAASWSIQTTPNGAGAEHSALYDIACEPESTSACTAVGKQTISGTSSPYAQYWNGSTWVNQTAATPAGATGGELQADHCLSKTSCVSAGSYTTKSGTFSLAEAWNGTSWSVQTTPNPEGATETKLRGVSCKVITACIAVGQSDASGKWATAMRGNSGTWSLQTVPKPAESISSELNGVECTSSTSCVAVGVYNTNASTYWAMAAAWNGTEWSLQTVPKPAESKKSVLLDVSCSDGSNCTAVGAYTNSKSVQVTFVQRWNGTSWSLQTSPNPVGSSNSVLQNVSCTNRYSCVAVGDWLNAGTWQPMAQYWNNTGWSLDTTGSPVGATFGLLEGVSCRITCLGIGWYTDSKAASKTLGEVRDIPSWTQQAIPEGVNLEGLFCVSGSSCAAAGGEGSAARTLLWNGTSWSASGKPVPPGASSSLLHDVSCTSSPSFACTAVGEYINSEGDEKPFAARYASGSWTVQTVPLPTEVTSGSLDDVSCTSSTACRAVGEHGIRVSPFEGEGPLVVVWNGTSWSVQSNPAGNREMHGISCASGSACLAVGTETSNTVLVERWNGSSWSAIADPTNADSLSSVSCTGESDCTVAGWGEGGYPFASHWNGTSWSQLSQAPRLAFSEFSYFSDISCTSASACVAVGKYYGGSNLLAASWDGTSWTLHDVAKPSGGELRGVSCLTATSCYAVGGGVAESFP